MSSQRFGDFDTELAANLKSAGIGAVSSFLAAEFVDALGLEGIPAGLVQSIGTATLTTIFTNLTTEGAGLFDGIGGNIGSAVGNYLGTLLAHEIINVDSVEGQIGGANWRGNWQPLLWTHRQLYWHNYWWAYWQCLWGTGTGWGHVPL